MSLQETVVEFSNSGSYPDNKPTKGKFGRIKSDSNERCFKKDGGEVGESRHQACGRHKIS
eukprot:2619309-Ditylum_brightwellii.AAC.1